LGFELRKLLHPLSSNLVDLGLAEVLDDPGAIEETVGSAGTAERLAALDDAFVALQVGLLDTAESAAAYNLYQQSQQTCARWEPNQNDGGMERGN
jgi:hypothetical protein